MLAVTVHKRLEGLVCTGSINPLACGITMLWASALLCQVGSLTLAGHQLLFWVTSKTIWHHWTLWDVRHQGPVACYDFENACHTAA